MHLKFRMSGIQKLEHVYAVKYSGKLYGTHARVIVTSFSRLRSCNGKRKRTETILPPKPALEHTSSTFSTVSIGGPLQLCREQGVKYGGCKEVSGKVPPGVSCTQKQKEVLKTAKRKRQHCIFFQTANVPPNLYVKLFLQKKQRVNVSYYYKALHPIKINVENLN